MTPKIPEWAQQARVDKDTLREIIRELEGILEQIEEALVRGNEREYDIAIGDWVGEAR